MKLESWVVKERAHRRTSVNMAAINCCGIRAIDQSLCSTSHSDANLKLSFSLLLSRSYSRPYVKGFTRNRLRVSYKRNEALQKCLTGSRVSCLLEDTDDGYPETEQSFVSNNSEQEAAIDLKLPRRSLLVTFTCNVCDTRSQRLINRLAYERGLVYVQCSGCSQYHKLVDNLGLVTEYNLLEETDQDARKDQV